jgi:hypothetical protein
MKHLKKFLFMKRWRDTDKKGEPVPNDATAFQKKHRPDAVQTTMDMVSGEEAPWKVGR